MIVTGTIDSLLKSKSADLWSIPPETTVFQAIEMMADKNVGSLLVTSNEKLVGIVSERDYTRKVALKGKSSKSTSVKEIISVMEKDEQKNEVDPTMVCVCVCVCVGGWVGGQLGWMDGWMGR